MGTVTSANYCTANEGNKQLAQLAVVL